MAADIARRDHIEVIMRQLEKRTEPRRVPPIVIIFLIAAGAALLATGEQSRQTQPGVISLSGPAFEVATVRPNKSGSRARSIGYPPNRFVATNMPLRWLIGNAYGDMLPFRQDMILGGPSWIDSDGYDVEAKASSTSPDDGGSSPDVIGRKLMLRTLLADRFALKLRTETRELPFYALVVARADGKMGPRVTPSTGEDCVNGSPSGDASNLPSCGPGGPRPRGETGGYFVTMAEIAKTVGQFLNRPALDKTGVSGRFTFELHFTPPPRVTLAPGAPADPAVDANTASLFTAVQEQLGLKLEAKRGPLEVLVIDAAERPTPD